MEDKEFIKQISNAARSFEAPYEEGAWEDFIREREDKPTVFMWRYVAAAAAVVFILLGGWWYKLANEKVEPAQNMASSSKKQQPVAPVTSPNPAIVQRPVVAQSPVVSQSESLPGTTVAGMNQTAIATKTKQQAVGTVPADPRNIYTGNNNLVQMPVVSGAQKQDFAIKSPSTQNMFASQRPDSASNNLMAHNQQKPEPANNSVLRQNTVDDKPIYDKLVHQNSPKKIEPEAGRNFNYALAVNPALGNKKVSVGVGFEVAYAVNDHVSIGSGLGYASLHAQTDGNDAAVAARQLQGTDLDVSGVEVPVNLRYQTGGGFYVNAGISAVAVVSNQMAYHYLSQTPTALTMVSSSGNFYQALRTTPTSTVEESKESLQRYIGFYTLSVGKRQAIGKKQINWGPFLKVPFNPVSSQDIRLTQGGFRLSFEF